MSRAKLIFIVSIILIGIILSIPLFSQTSLPQGKYAFFEKIIKVSGTSSCGLVNIDFPSFLVGTSPGTIKSQVNVNLTDATQVIFGGTITISGFGNGTSQGLTLYDSLIVDGQFTYTTDGSMQYLYNGTWLNLAPGQSFSETTQSTTYMSCTGQFTTVTSIINHGIWDKSNVSAPNLATPGPSPDPTPVSILCGDVSGDTLVDIVDALSIARFYIGLPPAAFMTSAADVNGDGSVTIVDALWVAQYYVGIRTALACQAGN